MVRTVDSSPPVAATLRALVCLDGSPRSADALAPAVALASARGETVSVVALADDNTSSWLTEQLHRVGLEVDQAMIVPTTADMLSLVLREAELGATPVISAFGPPQHSGRLSGLLGDLVRSDVVRVLAIGPQVTETPAGDGAIIVSSDGVFAVDPLIEATSEFVGDTTSKIVVARVMPPTERGTPYSTERDTAKFRHHFDVAVEPAAVSGEEISTTLAELARTEHASLIVARSWHRWDSQRPESASSSLAIVAHAPCPVLIVN